MNEAMYEHPATRENIRLIESRGVTIVEPEIGFLAEREFGVGRLAAQPALVTAIDAVFERKRDLEGERVLITAGPTREAIDPVRFLSNASTGTMGIELAREALLRGGEVDLILGPTTVAPPRGARVVRVTSAQEMYEAAMARFVGADVAIASAAVADWRPNKSSLQKVKKGDGPSLLALERTPDILASLGERRSGAFLVGFAAETEKFEEYAREKLRSKHLDAIAVNDVRNAGIGFGTGDNDVVMLWGEAGRRELGRASKRTLARRLWDTLLEIRQSRA